MRSVGLDVHQKYTYYTEVDNSARPDSYESID